MEHEALTEAIIGCAYSVYNTLGGGFLESVYEKCMVIELRKLGFKVETQKAIDVWYQGHPVGQFYADIVVEDLVIVELKAIRELAKSHEIQLVNYLAATGKSVGLLINFGAARVEVKRKFGAYSRV